LRAGTCLTKQQEILNDKWFTSTDLAASWGRGLPQRATINHQW
jgi:hypothetical protein